jgi:chromosome segregation ATPase
MTDFVNLRRNIMTEKERLEKLHESNKVKLSAIISELTTALDFLSKSEIQLKELENKLNERKKDEIAYQEEKKGLLNDIESLKEQIERLNVSINDENEKISKLETENSQLDNDLASKQQDLSSTQHQLEEIKRNNQAQTQEKIEINARMENRIAEANKVLQDLEAEKKQDMQVNPIIDFLLKEVRIDIPEVEILSTLAYRNQAMGLEELKQAVSKTPPVVILKVVRSLDSKGIIKYDERLDTIEIIANLI